MSVVLSRPVCESESSDVDRRMAESPCSLCGDPIGYGRECEDDEGSLVHSACLDYVVMNTLPRLVLFQAESATGKALHL